MVILKNCIKFEIFSVLHEVTKLGSCKCCEDNTRFLLRGFGKGLVLLQRETHLENLTIELVSSCKGVAAIIRKKSHLISWKSVKWREYVLIAVVLLTLWDSSVFQWSLTQLYSKSASAGTCRIWESSPLCQDCDIAFCWRSLWLRFMHT